MPIRVQFYQADGIMTGTVTDVGALRDLLERRDRLALVGATWAPLDGSAEQRPGSIEAEVEAILVASTEDDQAIPVHAVWHEIRLGVGPYLVHGELPTMPGFDPGRALTRPTGSFVLLRDVRIQLAEQPTAGTATHAHALVNRYEVDEVTSDLMLAFFFPGAHFPPDPGAAASA